MSIWPWNKSAEATDTTELEQKPWSANEEAAWRAEAGYSTLSGRFRYVVGVWLHDGEDAELIEILMPSECASLELFANELLAKNGSFRIELNGRKIIFPYRAIVYFSEKKGAPND